MTVKAPTTMEPRAEVFRLGVARTLTPNFTNELLLKNLFLAGGPAATEYGFANQAPQRIAVFNGHEFEVLRVTYGRDSYDRSRSYRSVSLQVYGAGNTGKEHPQERTMLWYFPVDQRLIETDVAGAIRAYPNEDNTGWLFAHTDEGTHHDYELRLLGAIEGLVSPYFRQLHVDSFSPSETARATARNAFTLLSEFYVSVVVEARKRARQIWLGQREQEAHPREGWLDRDINASIAKVKAGWTEERSTDLLQIATAIAYFERSLVMPTVETRWDRAARLAREAEEEAGAGD